MTVKKPTSGWNLRRVSTHPGEMLREEFLIPLGITAECIGAEDSCACNAHRRHCSRQACDYADTALRWPAFSQQPGVLAELQQMHDLSKARLELNKTMSAM